MKDQTRKKMDELGHLYVKDALEHALKMKYALMLIQKIIAGGNVDINEIDAICDRAIKDI